MAQLFSPFSSARLRSKGNEAIEGLAEIRKALKDLTVREIHSINLSATRAGASVIRKYARRNLPQVHRKKVNLRRSGRRTRRGQRVSFNVGPIRGHSGLRFLEYGAEPHEIGPKLKRTLVLNTKGSDNYKDIVQYDTFFSRDTVEHPGIKPTYFLSRALHESREEVLKRMGQQYWKRIKAVKAKRRR